jgi:hypothetical protein
MQSVGVPCKTRGLHLELVHFPFYKGRQKSFPIWEMSEEGRSSDPGGLDHQIERRVDVPGQD